MRFIQFKIYLSICLPVSIYVCVPVVIYYFGFPVFIDTIEGTNEWTNGRTNRRTAIPHNVYPSHRESVTNINQGVAFIITFLLFIEYMYLKTEESQDVTLPEQPVSLLRIQHKWNRSWQKNTRQFSEKSVEIKMACFLPCRNIILL